MTQDHQSKLSITPERQHKPGELPCKKLFLSYDDSLPFVVHQARVRVNSYLYSSHNLFLIDYRILRSQELCGQKLSQMWFKSHHRWELSCSKLLLIWGQAWSWMATGRWTWEPWNECVRCVNSCKPTLLWEEKQSFILNSGHFFALTSSEWYVRAPQVI